MIASVMIIGICATARRPAIARNSLPEMTRIATRRKTLARTASPPKIPPMSVSGSPRPEAIRKLR